MAHFAHYKEAHPLVFVIQHWIIVISMLVLIFTGFIIHFPFIPHIMGYCRGLHIFFGCVLVINMFLRILLSFFVKSAPTGGSRVVDKDYKTFMPQKDNKHQLLPWLKYYLFAKKDHPLSAKLGPLQKISYDLICFLVFPMAYTGFCIYNPLMDVSIFAWGNNLVGGAMNMRMIHYFMMFVFIWFMFIHIYLANIYGPNAAKLMFLRKESPGFVYDPETHAICGVDNMDGTGVITNFNVEGAVEGSAGAKAGANSDADASAKK